MVGVTLDPSTHARVVWGADMLTCFPARRCAAAEAANGGTAGALELQTASEPVGTATAAAFEARAPRERRPELDYGCVDWFIYGAADGGAAPAVLAA